MLPPGVDFPVDVLCEKRVAVTTEEAPLPWQRILLQTMESWQRAGVSGLVPEVITHTPFPPVPTAPLAVSITPTESESDMARRSNTSAPKSVETATPVPPPPTGWELPVLSRPKRIEKLSELAACVSNCSRCAELSSTRTQTVFGVGNPQARIVFIGEAPGADEDEQGEPFVGRAGQLLNKIIEAMTLKREELYICNILRCRPPGNRAPQPDEAANCREYLDGQLATIQPEYIVCWGTSAAQNLLGATDTIGKMRKTFYNYRGAKVLCTYHPSYLLRNPPAKKDVWEDMQLLMHELGIPIPASK